MGPQRQLLPSFSEPTGPASSTGRSEQTLRLPLLPRASVRVPNGVSRLGYRRRGALPGSLPHLQARTSTRTYLGGVHVSVARRPTRILRYPPKVVRDK